MLRQTGRHLTSKEENSSNVTKRHLRTVSLHHQHLGHWTIQAFLVNMETISFEWNSDDEIALFAADAGTKSAATEALSSPYFIVFVCVARKLHRNGLKIVVRVLFFSSFLL